MSAVARRYARAAVDAASEAGGPVEVDRLITDVRGFRASLESSVELQHLVSNPALVNERQDVLGVILDQAGLSEISRALIQTLVQNDRVDELHDVVESAEFMADELAKRLHADVASPIELSDEQVSRLRHALEKRLGRSVVIDVRVAPELIGGLVVQVGDLEFDSSVRRQIEIMRERLEAAAS